jgi:hypothetical protein
MIIKVTLTVEGNIQTEDLWTTGATSYNDWAKPMYYIWLDDNGNSADARYGNGAGPSTHQIRFDTGRLYLEVINGDITTYGPITETAFGSNQWSDNTYNIHASIINNGKSLQVSFPLSLIDFSPTLEISAMTSPWTTSAVDNTGSGSGNNDGWIIISNTSIENSYEDTDVPDESLIWPSGLSNSTVIPNFNISKIEAQLFFMENGDSDHRLENGAIRDGAIGFEIWLIIIAIIIVIIVIALIMMKKKQ